METNVPVNPMKMTGRRPIRSDLSHSLMSPRDENGRELTIYPNGTREMFVQGKKLNPGTLSN